MKDTIKKAFEKWCENDEYSQEENDFRTQYPIMHSTPAAFYAGFMARERMLQKTGKEPPRKP